MAQEMKRIGVDFNTLASEPIDLVKIAEAGSEQAKALPSLKEGERVLLWEPGLEVEATIILYNGHYWMAQPDRSTWHDVPLLPEDSTPLQRVP